MKRQHSRAGTSLIEALVAVVLLAVVMIGILQVISISLVQSQGAAARTQLMYKCQQVAEMIRMSQYLGVQGSTKFATDSGIGYPLAVVSNRAMPYDSSDTTNDPAHVGNYAFWGPDGANVIEKPKDAYRLFYTVENAGSAGFRVRVTAYPADSPNIPATADKYTPAKTYMGKGSKLKVIEYVAQISNS